MDDQDWTNPDTCIALFMRIKEDKGFRVNFDTQRALKRLDEKHFLGKVKAAKKKHKLKWNADIKAKLSKYVKTAVKLPAKPNPECKKRKEESSKPLTKKPKKENVEPKKGSNEPEKIKGEELLDDSLDDLLDRCEDELVDPEKSKSPEDKNVTKNVEVLNPILPKKQDVVDLPSTSVKDDLAYVPDVTFSDHETHGNNCTCTICSLSSVIARGPAGPGVQLLRRAEQQFVMHFFTGKSFYQFVSEAGLEVVSLTTSFTLSITSYSRTCKGSRPEAGTEMILGPPLIT